MDKNNFKATCLAIIQHRHGWSTLASEVKPFDKVLSEKCAKIGVLQEEVADYVEKRMGPENG